MFESFESRRLFAASATLTPDGVLGVVGTNESDRIAVGAVYSFKVPEDGGAAEARIASYSVTVNGKALGTFDGDEVKRINVFALGGNDRVSGPATGVRTAPARFVFQPVKTNPTRTTAGGTDVYTVADFARDGGATLYASAGGTIASISPAAVAPMYVEGGSGNDGISGSTGNDTLRGGRGDDYLFGNGGLDLLDGQSGDDTVYADDGTGGGLAGNRVAAAFRTGDVILSNAGVDTIYSDERDSVRFGNDRKSTPLVDVVGVTVSPFEGIID